MMWVKKRLSERMEEAREVRKERGIRHEYKKWKKFRMEGINLGIFLFFVK